MSETEKEQWILCAKRLPDERASMFAKFKNTNRWKEGMFERISDNVEVTVEFEDGTRKTEVAHTIDGVWKFDSNIIKRTVIAWKPFPEPYKEV